MDLDPSPEPQTDLAPHRVRARTWPYIGLVLLALVACGAMLWLVAEHLEHSVAVSPPAASSDDEQGALVEEDDEDLATALHAAPAGPLLAGPLVAARVGTAEVAARELDVALAHLVESARLRGEAPDWRWREAQRARLLDERIEAMLLEQHLAPQAAAITAVRVEQAFESLVAERFQGRREHLEGYLAASGRSREALERELRLDLALRDALGGASAMAPDEATLQAIWQAHRAAFAAPARARVDVLAVLPRGTDEVAWRAARKLAGAVGEALAAPRKADARVLVRRHGGAVELSVAAERYVMHGELPRALDRALFGAASQPEPGTVLGPIAHGGQLWLIRVVEYRAAGTRLLDEVRDVVEAQARQQRLERGRAALARRLVERIPVARLDALWYRRLQRRLMPAPRH